MFIPTGGLCFQKMGKTPMSRSQGQKIMVITERPYHKKYSIAFALTVQKLLARLKFSKKWVKIQGQGHRVKNNGAHGKVLSQAILMWNIKALAFTVLKLLARLKFQRGGQNDRQNKYMYNMPPDLRYRGHKIMAKMKRLVNSFKSKNFNVIL